MTEDSPTRLARNHAGDSLPRRRALLVLGMHRSGTSAVTRVVNLLGADLPTDLMPPAPDNNETGFWESIEVAALNDRVLASAGTTWDDIARFPEAWFGTGAAAEARGRIARVLERDFSSSPLFVLKDPRICRLVPLWRAALEEFGAELGYVLVLRHPLEVAASLKRRDGFLPAKSLLLWLSHLLDSERATRGQPRGWVHYESLLRDWRRATRCLARDLGLGWPSLGTRSAVEIENFLSDRQRHYRYSAPDLESRADVVEWVKRLYAATLDARRDDGAQLARACDEVSAQLEIAERAFGPLVADGQLRLAQREREGNELRDALLGREQEVRHLNGELEARLGELGERERESRLLGNDLASRQAKIEEVEASLSEAVRRIEERDRSLSAREQEVGEQRQEIERLHGAVRKGNAEIERQGTELAAARSELTAERARLSEMASESAATSSKLAAATQDLAATRQDLAAAQEDLAAAREDLAAADRKLTATREDLAAAREDLAAAREDLAAARQRARARDARHRQLARTVEERDRTLAELRQAAAGLQKQVDESSLRLAAVESSASWRITRPLRAAMSWARRAPGHSLFRYRRHRLLPVPPGNSATDAEARSVLELRSSKAELPTGWVRLDFSADRNWSELRPVLWVGRGGGEPLEPLRLARPESGHLRRLVRLPDSVHDLRLETAGPSAALSIRALAARECGALEAAALRLAEGRGRRRERAGGNPAGPQTLEAQPESGVPFVDEYDRWVAECDSLVLDDRERICRRISSLGARPLVSVIMTAEGAAIDSAVARSLASLRAQLYPKWELLLALAGTPAADSKSSQGREDPADRRLRTVDGGAAGDGIGQLNTALAEAHGELVALLEPGDQMTEQALYAVVEELDSGREADLLYGDEDEIDEAGRRSRPFFKPDWSPDLLRARDYLRGPLVFRKSVLEELGGFRDDAADCPVYDLVLRLSEIVPAERIRHLPRILCHRAARPAVQEKAQARERAERRALGAHFERRRIPAEIHDGDETGRRRIVYPIDDRPPLVSVIVPTKDQATLLRRCIDGLLHRTDYPRLEVLVMDNDSTEPAALRYLDEIRSDPRVRVVPWRKPFDHSEINNDAVALARGELLAFLNDDIEVASEGWLREMAGHALRPEIGAVGAMLLYPSGKIQHAGIVLGPGGVAALRHRGRDGSDVAYDRAALVARNLSAVTAACLVTRRSVFEEVGGFDAGNLKVAFNDVDLCLKIRDRGYWIVWTPHARLTHHESQSLGRHDRPERGQEFEREVALMHSRWGEQLRIDPFYNPNLSVALGMDYQLAFPPR